MRYGDDDEVWREFTGADETAKFSQEITMVVLLN